MYVSYYVKCHSLEHVFQLYHAIANNYCYYAIAIAIAIIQSVTLLSMGGVFFNVTCH